MESCDGCTKLKDYATANKYLMKNNEELEIEVENLQAQIEALHTQISDLKQKILRPKPNVLGAGRKPKVTPKIIESVLMLREQDYSFGDIAKTINEVSPVKISRSTAYEIYDKYGRGQSSFSSDNLQPKAEKTT